MTREGLEMGSGMEEASLVIIDVEEGYREDGLEAMAGRLCRSGGGCGELVEVLFCGES